MRLQYINQVLLLCSFLSWDLTGVTMRLTVICWLRLMYWPMTVLPGKVYGFLVFPFSSHHYFLERKKLWNDMVSIFDSY